MAMQLMSRLPRFDRLSKSDGVERKLGLGAPLRGLGADQARARFIAGVGQAMQMPTFQLPTVESVRIHYDGPLSPAAIQGSFGAVIDPLGSNANSPPPGASSVESTLASPSEFQTWALILAIGWHLEPEPIVWTQQGNSLSPVPATSIKQPVSPDDFSVADTVIATGTLGLTTGQTLTPALALYGWWAEKAFYHMVRAYNLEWQWGNRINIIRDSLRFTAHTPSNGQEGSASSFEVDTNFSIRGMNNYYVENLASTSIFLPIDRTRIGNMTLGGNAGLSVYRPTRAYEKVNASYGGMGLRASLRGNEFRRLATPFLMKPGVPIGLKAQVSNTDDQTAMQNWLSADFGLGVIPADFTSYSDIASGAGVTGTAVVGAEPSLDSVVAPEGITTITDRVIYKVGGFKLTVALKGFELTDDQAEMLRDGGFRAALGSSCNCQIPSC